MHQQLEPAAPSTTSMSIYATDYLLGYHIPINPNPDFDTFNDNIVLYNYIPDLGFNIFATVVWGLTTIAHTWLLRQRGTRIIQSYLAFGAMWMVIAYAVRTVNHTLIYRADLFFTQFAITEAAPFLVYGAVLNAIDDTPDFLARNKWWIRILSIYAVVDAIIVIIGASLLGHGYARVATDLPQGSTDYVQVGYAVLRTGEGNQVAFLTIVMGVITWLLITAVRRHQVDLRWTVMLFVTVGMLWMRAIFHLAMIGEGVFGNAWSSETYFGIFSFAPLWAAVTIWAIVPLGSVVGKDGLDRKERLSSV